MHIISSPGDQYTSFYGTWKRKHRLELFCRCLACTWNTLSNALLIMERKNEGEKKLRKQIRISITNVFLMDKSELS